MKKLFILFFLATCIPAFAALQRISVTLTVTNAANVRSGTNFTFNGDTRMGTNSAFTPTFFQTNNTPAGLATNIYTQLSYYPFAGGVNLQWIDPTNIQIIAPVNGACTISTPVTNWCYFTYSTQTVTVMLTVRMPIDGEFYSSNRQIIASQIVDAINRYSTNQLATNLSLTLGFVTATNGFSTNQIIASPHTTNGTFFAPGIQGIATNIGIVYGGQLKSNNLFGASAWSIYVLSDPYYLNAYGPTNPAGILFALGNTDPALTPAISYIKSVINMGYPGLYDALVSTNLALDIVANQGFDAINNRPEIILNVKTARQLFGVLRNELGSNFWQNQQIWNFGAGTNTFLTPVAFLGAVNIISNGGFQILGAGNILQKASLMDNTSSNFNTLPNTTNTFAGSIAYPFYNLTTLANGNNISVPFGTNRNIRLAPGGLTGVASICGIVGASASGGNNGQEFLVFNDTGFVITFAQNTVDPVPANRIENQSGSDVAVVNQGWINLSWSPQNSKWKVYSSYPSSAAASVTNAVGTIKTNGSTVSASAVSLNLIWGTNVTMQVTNTAGAVDMAISSSGGGGAQTPWSSDINANLKSLTNAAAIASGQFTGNGSGITNLGNVNNTAFQPGNSVLSNLIGTVNKNITNMTSLSTSNATSKPLTNSYSSGVLTLLGLEQGANVTLTPNGSNIVVASTGGGGGPSTNSPPYVLVASGTNVTIDFSALVSTNTIRYTLVANTGYFVTNVIDGKDITLELKQDATGNRTIAANSTAVPNSRFGSDITGITLTTNAGYYDLVKLHGSGTNCQFAGFVRGYAP